jgi:lipoate-protein ligase A
MKPVWRALSHPPQSAEINMAIDEAVALAFSEGKVPPTLRLYRWAQPSLSIGSFQKLEPEWIDRFGSNALPLVRRITGGRALLHDRELTYSVVAGARDPLFPDGIKGTFYTIARGLLAGMKRLGVDAEIHVPSERRPLQSPLCFESTSWYEITAAGRKVIGSAQKRWVGHFLQHGSLILEKSPRIESFPDLVSENQTTLANLLTTLPNETEIEQAFLLGFGEALSIQLEPGALTEEERAVADRLVKEKYGASSWTLQRQIKGE